MSGSQRDITCSQHSSNQGDRTPVYGPEMWTVPKDTIYAAIAAIELALGYMPHIKTDVPQWQKTSEEDTQRMIHAVRELRKLPHGGILITPAKNKSQEENDERKEKH